MLPPPGLESLIPDAPLTSAIVPTAAVAAEATLTVLSALTPTSAPTSTPEAGSPSDDDNNTGECRLLGPFALWVQLALGGLALLSLVYKRWKERPQRPLQIWFFDVSKQVVGSALVHVANVFMSMLTSGRFSIKVGPGTVATTGSMLLRLMRRDGEDAGGGDDGYVPNPCSFYLLNLAIDTTLGIPILIILLRICTGLASFTSLGVPPESIQSGNYGDPPNWRWWGKQSLIYFCGLFGMKICVLIIFVVMPWISQVGDWALGWTEGNEKLQIIFVMMLFPLIMNALQYYIIDSFIMKHAGPAHHERLPGEDPETDDARGGNLGAYDDGAFRPSGESMDSEREALRRQSKDDEYNPDIDGHASTVVGSSSSSANKDRGRLLNTDLFPKE